MPSLAFIYGYVLAYSVGLAGSIFSVYLIIYFLRKKIDSGKEPSLEIWKKIGLGAFIAILGSLFAVYLILAIISKAEPLTYFIVTGIVSLILMTGGFLLPKRGAVGDGLLLAGYFTLSYSTIRYSTNLEHWIILVSAIVALGVLLTASYFTLKRSKDQMVFKRVMLAAIVSFFVSVIVIYADLVINPAPKNPYGGGNLMLYNDQPTSDYSKSPLAFLSEGNGKVLGAQTGPSTQNYASALPVKNPYSNGTSGNLSQANIDEPLPPSSYTNPYLSDTDSGVSDKKIMPNSGMYKPYTNDYEKYKKEMNKRAKKSIATIVFLSLIALVIAFVLPIPAPVAYGLIMAAFSCLIYAFAYNAQYLDKTIMAIITGIGLVVLVAVGYFKLSDDSNSNPPTVDLTKPDSPKPILSNPNIPDNESLNKSSEDEKTETAHISVQQEELMPRPIKTMDVKPKIVNSPASDSVNAELSQRSPVTNIAPETLANSHDNSEDGEPEMSSGLNIGSGIRITSIEPPKNDNA